MEKTELKSMKQKAYDNGYLDGYVKGWIISAKDTKETMLIKFQKIVEKL